MKSLGNLPDPFWTEISGQPAALRRAAHALAEQEGTLEAVRSAGPGAPLVFTGMGASYDACYVPVTLLAELGRSATMVDAAELLHFRRRTLARETVLVVISQSGESAEVVRLVDGFREGDRPFVVSITNGSTNTLAGRADASFDTRAGREIGPSTSTFAATLVVLAAITEVLGGKPSDHAVAAVQDETERAAATTESLLDQSKALSDELASWAEGRRNVVILGRGTARAASETAALLLKEAARLPAEALETGQFRHGPLELAGPELAAAIVATEETTAALDLALAAELLEAEAAVLLVGGTGFAREGLQHVPLPPLGRAIAPAVAVVPFQLLGWRLAAERGVTPGELTRASKVTTRE